MTRRFLCIAVYALLISCSRSYIQPPFWSPRTAGNAYSTSPYLSLSYGDLKAFSSYNVYIVNNRLSDTGNHSYTITAFDPIHTLFINIKADSLVQGTYTIDRSNGSVMLLQSRALIGSLAHGFFSFVVYTKRGNTIIGAFTGMLDNPKYSMQEMSGSFANLVAN